MASNIWPPRAILSATVTTTTPPMLMPSQPDFDGMENQTKAELDHLNKEQPNLSIRDYYYRRDNLMARMRDIEEARRRYMQSMQQRSIGSMVRMAIAHESVADLDLPLETKFGEIEAMRVWRLGAVPLLTSVHFESYVWTPGAIEETEVKGGEHGPGFHAWKRQPSMHEYAGEYRQFPLVTGKVKLWGEVIEHERGYRAQFAKITGIDNLFLPLVYENLKTEHDAILGKLRDAYCAGRK